MESEVKHPIYPENEASNQARQRIEAIILKRARTMLEEPDAQRAAAFVMQNLTVVYQKYPCQDVFLSRLFLFTDEACKRILKEKADSEEKDPPNQARQRIETMLLKRARMMLDEPDAQRAVSLVMQNLMDIYRKYPRKEEFFLQIYRFTDEVCKRIYAENEERLTAILKFLEEEDRITEENECLESILKILQHYEQPLQEQVSQMTVQKPNEKLIGNSPRKRNKWAIMFSTFGLIMCVLIMLWMVVGLLMALDVCPEYDLGYQWFNKNVFKIF